MNDYLERLAVKKPAKTITQINVQEFTDFHPKKQNFNPLILKRLENVVIGEKDDDSFEAFALPKKKMNLSKLVLTSEEQDVTSEEETETPVNEDKNKNEEKVKTMTKNNYLKTSVSEVNLLASNPSPIRLKVDEYVMNNREYFVQFIQGVFKKYKKEINTAKNTLTCETVKNNSSDTLLMIHQQILQDYMNLYTPYRGLLLYHGLGASNNCISIAIAEGIKSSKKVIVMTPSTFEENYIEQLKKCGDSLFKKRQYWEWISLGKNPDTLQILSKVLNLSEDFISKQGGAFFVDTKKSSNYDNLDEQDKKKLEQQINKMIMQKYEFIHYNDNLQSKIETKTNQYEVNIFDNAVVIIDEVHQFVSRIVENLNKRKLVSENGAHVVDDLAADIDIFLKLYEMLLRASGVRIVALTGTPIMNSPYEAAVLFNILRGYIVTWELSLNMNKPNNKLTLSFLRKCLFKDESVDYVDFSMSKKVLTVTRNPFGFGNKKNKQFKYKGVERIDTYLNDKEFLEVIKDLLEKENIEITDINIKYFKALPDEKAKFDAMYIDAKDSTMKNADAFKRRILGLTSYFPSEQESLLPKLKNDYNILQIPMSDEQFKIYQFVREEERKKESKTDEDKYLLSDRINSRLVCNYAVPDKSYFSNFSLDDKNDNKEMDDEVKMNDEGKMDDEGKEEKHDQVKNDDEEEVDENDDSMLIHMMRSEPEKYLTKKALEIYSPKFLEMLKNIQHKKHEGLHLVQSQFRNAEGISLFSEVLKANGFAEFKLLKNEAGVWKIDIPHENKGKPTFALYTETESDEEREILGNIFNGEWNKKGFPKNIREELERIHSNNNMGEIIKVLMITVPNSERLELRNVRYLHFMDPCWEPFLLEQTLYSTRRICSHQNLEPHLRTIEIFIYLMTFADDHVILNDKSNWTDRPITTDEYLYELSEEKSRINQQFLDVIKQSAIDCHIYSESPSKCVQFGSPLIGKFAFDPDYKHDEERKLTKTNKEWEVEIVKDENGLEYIAEYMDNNGYQLYAKKSGEQFLEKPSKDDLVKVGKMFMFINEEGESNYRIILD